MIPPSGEQFELVHGEHRATVVEVGGGIRSYTFAGHEVLDSYPREEISDGAHGSPLIPWPNRLADGRYSFDGVDYQLPLTEPTAHNAIHGLLRWRNWAALERASDRVVMGIRLHPMTGWPFPLEVSVAYSLADDGLTVHTRVRNQGRTACPFGAGQHPYLSAGGGALDECTLQFAAGTRILVDAERQLPTGAEPVGGTEFDFGSPRRIDALEVDHAFRDLERDADGRAWVRLARPDGRTVSLWCDERYSLVQLYTGDTLAPHRRRRGLAAEPLTCPPNALQTGEDIITLESGQAFDARWGVALS